MVYYSFKGMIIRWGVPPYQWQSNNPTVHGLYSSKPKLPIEDDNIMYTQYLLANNQKYEWIAFERETGRTNGRRLHQAIKNPQQVRVSWIVADRTGLEPATSGVTGRHSNRLNYRSAYFSTPAFLLYCPCSWERKNVVGGTRLELVTHAL